MPDGWQEGTWGRVQLFYCGGSQLLPPDVPGNADRGGRKAGLQTASRSREGERGLYGSEIATSLGERKPRDWIVGRPDPDFGGLRGDKNVEATSMVTGKHLRFLSPNAGELHDVREIVGFNALGGLLSRRNILPRMASGLRLYRDVLYVVVNHICTIPIICDPHRLSLTRYPTWHVNRKGVGRSTGGCW